MENDFGISTRNEPMIEDSVDVTITLTFTPDTIKKALLEYAERHYGAKAQSFNVAFQVDAGCSGAGRYDEYRAPSLTGATIKADSAKGFNAGPVR